MIRAIRKSNLVGIWLVAGALVGFSPLFGGPTADYVNITDVTPRSFRVLWLSNEPSVPNVNLFLGPSCATPVSGAVIIRFPSYGGNASIADAAKQRGLMLVEVAGLSPGSEYCVQIETTSIATGDVTTGPLGGITVLTEARSVRSKPLGNPPEPMAFANDIARAQVPVSSPPESLLGSIAVLLVANASSPLTTFVGDGFADPETPFALFDLNNLYDSITHESMDLKGDQSEGASVVFLGLAAGAAAQSRIVPAESGLSEVVDFQGTCLGAPMSACDGLLGDVDSNGVVDGVDADSVRDLVSGQLSTLSCMVCGDVTLDSIRDMKDALALGQAAVGLRVLP